MNQPGGCLDNNFPKRQILRMGQIGECLAPFNLYSKVCATVELTSFIKKFYRVNDTRTFRKRAFMQFS